MEKKMEKMDLIETDDYVVCVSIDYKYEYHECVNEMCPLEVPPPVNSVPHSSPARLFVAFPRIR